LFPAFAEKQHSLGFRGHSSAIHRMNLKLNACIAQHQGDQKEQQDRAALIVHRRIENACLAVVADGMGGHTGGAQAAEQVIVSASLAFQSWGIDNDPRQLMEDSLLEAHSMIRASRYLNEKDPHSTAVLLVLLPDRRCFWNHCGDSRLYYFRGRQLLFQTQDHSYVEHLVRRGRITREAAKTHPNRNILLTSLGGKDTPEVESCDLGKLNIRIQDQDSFLLCTDGLWTYFSEQELGEIITSLPVKEAVARIITLARERAQGDGDNLSAILLQFQEEKKTYVYQENLAPKSRQVPAPQAATSPPPPPAVGTRIGAGKITPGSPNRTRACEQEHRKTAEATMNSARTRDKDVDR
jgi:serine/threonine protein phosphatase PrpC